MQQGCNSVEVSTHFTTEAKIRLFQQATTQTKPQKKVATMSGKGGNRPKGGAPSIQNRGRNKRQEGKNRQHTPEDSEVSDFGAESPPEKSQHQQQRRREENMNASWGKHNNNPSSDSDDDKSVSRFKEKITSLEAELEESIEECAAEKKNVRS
jgi:hypothetical protein